MLKIHQTVAVYRAADDVIAFRCGPAQAMQLLASNRAQVKQRQKKTIRSIELLEAEIPVTALGLRAGSFGIEAHRAACGKVYYQHRNTWDVVQASA